MSLGLLLSLFHAPAVSGEVHSDSVHNLVIIEALRLRETILGHISGKHLTRTMKSRA